MSSQNQFSGGDVFGASEFPITGGSFVRDVSNIARGQRGVTDWLRLLISSAMVVSVIVLVVYLLLPSSINPDAFRYFAVPTIVIYLLIEMSDDWKGDRFGWGS